MKIVTTFLKIMMLCSLMVSLPCFGQQKISHRDRMSLEILKEELQTDRHTRSEESKFMTVLVKVTSGTTEKDLTALGSTVTAAIGDIFVVETSLDNIDVLLNSEKVISAQFDHSDKPDMYYARMEKNSNINTVHSDLRKDLGHTYMGEGVICGVFDIGFDVNHIDFYDNEDRSRTRVKKLIQFTGSSSTPTLDTEDVERIKAYTTDKKDAKHGTHVLGIMAGGYRGPGRWDDADFGSDSVKYGLVSASAVGHANPDGTKPVPYYGVAPKADIAICGNASGLYGGAQLTAATRIIEYAEKQGKPCVINYSLGSQWGPRDGSALDDQALSELAKKAIICKSAGNDGRMEDYFSETLTDERNSIATALIFKSIGDNTGELEFWLNDSRSVEVEIFAIGTANGETKEFTLLSIPGPTLTPMGNPMTKRYVSADLAADFKTIFSGRIGVSAGVEKQNNRYCIEFMFDNGFQMHGFTVDGVRWTRTQIGIRLKGESGQRIDGNCCGNYVKFQDKEGYVKPSPCLSIANGSCAKNIIAVGSYSNRTAIRYLDNHIWRETSSDKGCGDIAPSSGYGILYDGRSLPQVATPGVNIVSASSRFCDPDVDAVAVGEYNGENYYFCEMSGTSMSCPLFAGICALWLEADPSLDYDGIMDVLEHTARQDAYTEAKPVRFGYGKADAYEGLKYVLAKKDSGVSSPLAIDADKFMVTKIAPDTWEVTVGLGENFSVDLVSLSGIVAKRVSGQDTVSISTAGCEKGVYALRVQNGKFVKSYKIII